jgi:hypothetical protein
MAGDEDVGEFLGPGDPLHKFLQSERVTRVLSTPVVDDERRVQAVIDLANGRPFRLRAWDQLSDGVAGAAPGGDPEKWEADLGRRWGEVLATALEAITAGDTSTARSRQALQFVESQAERALVTVPRMVRKGTQLQLEHRVVCVGLGGAIGYGVAITTSSPFRERLRRCEACGAFFLREQRGKHEGRPRDTYCSEKCYVEGRRTEIREYMREKRAKERAARGRRS